MRASARPRLNCRPRLWSRSAGILIPMGSRRSPPAVKGSARFRPRHRLQARLRRNRVVRYRRLAVRLPPAMIGPRFRLHCLRLHRLGQLARLTTPQKQERPVRHFGSIDCPLLTRQPRVPMVSLRIRRPSPALCASFRLPSSSALSLPSPRQDVGPVRLRLSSAWPIRREGFPVQI